MPNFSGEFGGLIAAGWIAGFAGGWLACVKMMLAPERERAGKMEARLDRLMEKIETRFWRE